MNKNEICKTNMIYTATVGLILLSFIFFSDEPYKIPLLLLLYPVSFIITKLYVSLGIKNRLIGFFVGGTFSIVGTFAVLGVTSTFGTFKFFNPGEMDGIISIFWFFTALFAFFVGGIAGYKISSLFKNDLIY